LPASPTDEEILDLSARNPSLQFEQAPSGELIVTPTESGSGRRELALSAQLYSWARADGRGVAFGPTTGFRLPDDSLRCPDAAWITRERWDTLTPQQQEGFAPLCPDAVFEVRWRTDSLEEMRSKMRMYIANGARLAVLVDPERRSVEIYRLGDEPEALVEPTHAPLGAVLPGFIVELGPIWT
jgi:Uma2 family endonuclease